MTSSSFFAYLSFAPIFVDYLFVSVIGIEKEKKKIIFRTNYFLNKAKNNSKTSCFFCLY